MSLSILPSAPAATPVFLTDRPKIVMPTRFAIVLWFGRGDTRHAFTDQTAFERQRAAAERNLAHVQELSGVQAAAWIAAGGKAVLHEISRTGAAAFGDLTLAPA